MNIDITALLQALIGLLSALITAKLIPWLKTKIDAQNEEAVKALVRTLVFAAEQVLKNAGGTERLLYVKEELSKRGIIVDEAVIEATVYELNFFSVNGEKSVGHAMDGNL